MDSDAKSSPSQAAARRRKNKARANKEARAAKVNLSRDYSIST
jgi:hypothetical protein